jgi:hypothetical protein
MDPEGNSPQAAPGVLGHNRHVCALNSVDEQHRVLQPFVKDWFGQGDRGFYLIDPWRREEPNASPGKAR